MRRTVGLVAIVVVVAGVLSGCQEVKVGAKCKGNGAGSAGAWIVTCKGGRWTRLITKADGLAYLYRLQHPTPPATIPPATFTPPTTPPTAPRPVMATTTTTPAPAPPLLYPNPPGVDLFPAVGGGAPDGDADVIDESRDGRWVLASSSATNLVPGDTNSAADLFLHDAQSGVTQRVSVANSGAQSAGGITGDGAVSDDGRYLALTSSDNTLVAGDTDTTQPDLFVRDTVAGTTTMVDLVPGGVANSWSSVMDISADGSEVLIDSAASNLVPGDTNGIPDYFEVTLATGAVTRVDVSTTGVQADTFDAFAPFARFVADDRYVVFTTPASTMVAGDTNAATDVFVRDLTAQTTKRVSVQDDGSQFPGGATTASISDDGQRVAFDASTGAPTSPSAFLFVRDLSTQHTLAGAQLAHDPDNDSTLYHGLLPLISGDGRYVYAQGMWSFDSDPSVTTYTDLVTDLTTGVTQPSTRPANVVGNLCGTREFLSTGVTVTCQLGGRWSVPNP